MIRKSLIPFLAVLAVLPATAISHAAEAGPFNVQVLLPGMTKNIEIRQQEVLPFGCPQFFIFTVGSGMLGISLKKDDVAGDTIFMTGFVSTGGRLKPVNRLGVSQGMIDQVIEMEGGTGTLGFVWLWCGVAVSQNVSVYRAELRLSLQP